MANIKRKDCCLKYMKKITIRNAGSPRLWKRNSKCASIKKLCTGFKVSVSVHEDREGLPPSAPHNTTQEIIEYHKEILFNPEELLGSILMF